MGSAIGLSMSNWTVTLTLPSGVTISTGYTRRMRAAMLESWARSVARGDSVLMLAHSRKDVQELNELAREMRKGRGELTDGVIVASQPSGSPST